MSSSRAPTSLGSAALVATGIWPVDRRRSSSSNARPLSALRPPAERARERQRPVAAALVAEEHLVPHLFFRHRCQRDNEVIEAADKAESDATASAFASNDLVQEAVNA